MNIFLGISQQIGSYLFFDIWRDDDLICVSFASFISILESLSLLYFCREYISKEYSNGLPFNGKYTFAPGLMNPLSSPANEFKNAMGLSDVLK